MTQPSFPPVSAATVSVLICCYTENRWDDLLAAVQSVQAQEPPPGELLLVVDHNEQLHARLERALPCVRVVANEGARGLPGARNTGVTHARGEVLAFLDDDARAEPGWLAALVAAYEEDVLGVGGKVLAAWPGEPPAWFPHEFDWVVGCSYIGLPTSTAPVRNMIGANMSLRREAFEVAGGFSEELGRVGTYPAGCEETEMCIRARAQAPGARITYEPTARVRHRVTVERTSMAYFLRRCLAEGMSKAVVAKLAGVGAALESERAYLRHVLPRGVARGLLQGPSGLARSVVIVMGTLVTALGYARGRLAA